MVVEAMSLSGYVLGSKSEYADFFKPAVVLLFAILMFLLLWLAAVKLPKRWIVALCVLLSIGGVVVLQAFGYFFYPGLIKDVQFFSVDYLLLTLRSFSAIFFGLLLPSIFFLCVRALRLKQRQK